MADLEATYLVGKVKAKAHPFVEYFKFVDKYRFEKFSSGKFTVLQANSLDSSFGA